ncbi:MAG: hypothetical protein H6713_26690 [Myxococcales bacterium]|nr:hypothetical protein [Myxococcales bacterium]
MARAVLDLRAGRALPWLRGAEGCCAPLCRPTEPEPCAAEAEDVPGVTCVPYVEVPDACAPPVGVCELP